MLGIIAIQYMRTTYKQKPMNSKQKLVLIDNFNKVIISMLI